MFRNWPHATTSPTAVGFFGLVSANNRHYGVLETRAQQKGRIASFSSAGFGIPSSSGLQSASTGGLGFSFGGASSGSAASASAPVASSSGFAFGQATGTSLPYLPTMTCLWVRGLGESQADPQAESHQLSGLCRFALSAVLGSTLQCMALMSSSN